MTERIIPRTGEGLPTAGAELVRHMIDHGKEEQ